MKRNITLTLATFFMIINMIATTYTGSGVFKKVTKLTDLEDGAYYVLYGADEEHLDYYGALSNNTNQTPKAEAVTINENLIINPNENIVWKLEANEDNWRIFSESGNFYCEIIENDLKFSRNETATHDYTITVDNGDFTFTSNHAGANNRCIAIGTTTFKPYATNNGKDLFLYKLQKYVAASTTITATNVLNTSFTANWNTMEDAINYELIVYEKGKGIGATDLIISQYYEGKEYDKAIEIFNGTNSYIDLSSYVLKRQVNGEGDFGADEDDIALSGILNSGATYLIVCNYKSTSQALKDKADLTINTLIKSITGDDPVGLFKNNVMIDVVGSLETGLPNGLKLNNFAEDKTLTRIATVSSPNVTYNTAEWLSQNIGEKLEYIDGLGTHSMNAAGGFEPIDGSPFTVGNVTSYDVKNLSPSTTYVYTVITKAEGDATSEVSNKTEVTTTAGTETNINTLNTISGISFDNKYINNAQNVLINVYNISGKLLISSNSNINMQHYPAGIYIVNSANKTIKIINK